ncbi:porin family protein [Dysgonomonas sp. 520]|uniref:type IX secretion/gliding motility protein PorT/SprT n=1 Tax=Dysgonomonas sp. 520 TaxID=2302931 RepID=UPI0013D6E1CA|nr:porin family protein [Dysgonomonas sp. 520]NDW09214.1 PorT family protein [Dysgonomonas sp. 520]
MLQSSRYKILLTIIICFFCLQGYAQRPKVKNQPFADQKLIHFGFTIGIHGQDLIMSHTGASSNGEVWFAEIPSYNPGFSVGIIADRYINQYMNLRIVPSLHFGGKDYVFREQDSGEEYKTTIRSNYLTLPVLMKFSSERNNNIRPYALAGIYGATELGSKSNMAIKLKPMDFGLEFGIGCDFYLPMFKLCPELKFSFGLVNLVEKNRTDLTDKELQKYSDAIKSGKSRMITLTFNFE